MRDLELPKPDAGEVTVKMQAVRICGSDIRNYQKGRIREFHHGVSFVFGHECAGVVTDVGDGVNTLNVGDHVALEPGIPCGKCSFCLSGHYNLCPDVKFLATPPYDGCLME